MSAKVPTFKLNNGFTIPSVGLGTWMGKFDSSIEDEAYRTALQGIQNGYRYIDTAAGYNTEIVVGRAIHDSGVPREEIVIQTKLMPTYHGEGKVAESFNKSLEQLGTGTIDVYLMHWPIGWNEDWTVNDISFLDTWAQIEALLETGKCKTIGVCNFSVKNLEILLKKAKIVPAINQCEAHPYLPSLKLKEYCESKGIHFQAHTPLARGDSPVYQEPVVQRLAEKYSVTPSQILLAWGVYRGTSVLPKSSNNERQKLNIKLPELSKEEISLIDSIHKEDESKHKSAISRGTMSKMGGKIIGVVPIDRLGWDPILYE